jgi:hypothetical protein
VAEASYVAFNANLYHEGTKTPRKTKSSSPQISQKDADFEIEIGEIGVICGSLLPFLVSFRH